MGFLSRSQLGRSFRPAVVPGLPSEPRLRRAANGVRGAIGVSPPVAARVDARDPERMQGAAPGSRIVTLSVEALPDRPGDDVEVLLRGWRVAEAVGRLLARAPHLTWVHSAT